MQTDLFYQVSLSLVPGIGPVHTRLLAEHFGNAYEVFKASFRTLCAIEGIGEYRAKQVKQFDGFKLAEDEMRFIEKHNINTYFITDNAYPKRLLNCYDPPCLLYGKGEMFLNHQKIVAVIGTRNNTAYGRVQTEKLVEELKPYHILVVSGLALGIDAIAHKTAVKFNIPTIGIMANGIDRIYPPQHYSLVRDMITGGGGLLTELVSGTQPDRHHFPARNRIVAGMADAVVVMETARKGGSMITAELANGYNKDVLAFPGRASDPQSEGCNYLVQSNKAQLITGAADLAAFMRWDEAKKESPKKQRELFIDLGASENSILSLLNDGGQWHIDDIYHKSGCRSSDVAGALLQLEMHSLIKSLPGKKYECI